MSIEIIKDQNGKVPLSISKESVEIAENLASYIARQPSFVTSHFKVFYAGKECKDLTLPNKMFDFEQSSYGLVTATVKSGEEDSDFCFFIDFAIALYRRGFEIDLVPGQNTISYRIIKPDCLTPENSYFSKLLSMNLPVDDIHEMSDDAKEVTINNMANSFRDIAILQNAIMFLKTNVYSLPGYNRGIKLLSDQLICCTQQGYVSACWALNLAAVPLSKK